MDYKINHSKEIFKQHYKGFEILFNRAKGENVISIKTEDWKYIINSIEKEKKEATKIIPEPLLSKLSSLGILVKDGKMPQSLTDKHKNLISWIHLTNECNMGCSYCNILKRKGKITPENAEKLIDRLVSIAKIHQYDSISISLAGGEPTLNFDSIEAIARRVDTYKKEIKINLCLITNALRIEEKLVKLLKKYNILVSVSFDGLISSRGDEKKNHTIFQNLLMLKQQKVNVFCLITIDKISVKSLSKTVQMLIDNMIGFRFSVDKFIKMNDNNRDIILKSIKKAYNVIEKNLINLPPLSAFHRFGDTAISSLIIRSCPIQKHSLQIDTDFNVHLCHTDINFDKPVCNLFDVDPIEFYSNYDSPFAKISSVNDINICKDCEWKYQCGGGCPKLTFRTFGDINKPSPHCEIIKYSLARLIKLYGIQEIQKYMKLKKGS